MKCEKVESDSDGHLQCDAWEDVPTMMVQRHTFANMYHDTEDFWNVFFSIALLKLQRKDVCLEPRVQAFEFRVSGVGFSHLSQFTAFLAMGLF